MQRNGELVPRRQKSFTPALSASLPASLGTGSSCLTFTRDSQRLILSSSFGSTIVVVQLPEGKEDKCEVVSILGEGAPRAKKAANGTNGEDVEMNGADSDEESDEEESSAPSPASAKRVPSTIACLSVSNDGKHLATAETDRKVVVYDLASSKVRSIFSSFLPVRYLLCLLQVLSTLPTPPLVPTSLTFTPSTAAGEPTLLVTLSSNSILLYGLTSHRFHPWGLPLSSKKYNTLMDIREPALGVSFEPRRPEAASPVVNGIDESHIHPSRRAAVHSAGAESSVAVVWGANWVAKIDLAALKRGQTKTVPTPLLANGKPANVVGGKKQRHKKGKQAAAAVPERREADRKRAREDEDDLPLAAAAAGSSEPRPLDIKVTRRYQPLCLFDFVGQGELVAVERTWYDLAKDLPEAWVKAGAFGT